MNPTANPLIAWLKENILRFSAESPKFFKIWSIISGAFVLITGLPEALSLMNIHLPELWNNHVDTIVKWSSRGIFLMSMMTSQSKPVAVDQNGTPVKQTNPKKLPFTAIQETKAVIKEDARLDTPPVDTVQLDNPVPSTEEKK